LHSPTGTGVALEQLTKVSITEGKAK